MLQSVILKMVRRCGGPAFSLLHSPSHCHGRSVQHMKAFSANHSMVWSRGFHVSTSLYSDTYYTDTHEWIKVDGDVGTVGITDYAQGQLGDIVFCELPDVSEEHEKGDAFATVESVKAASDLYLPVSGKILTTNDMLKTQPSIINTSPTEHGWLVTLQITGSASEQLAGLMSETDYEKFKESESQE